MKTGILKHIVAVLFIFVLTGPGFPEPGWAQTAADGEDAVVDQDKQTPRLRTIDEIYLESEISVRTLRAQLQTNNQELQMVALAALEDQIHKGVVSRNNEDAFMALAGVMEEGAYKLTHSGQTIPRHYHPLVRQEAARIMGLMETDKVLTQLTLTVAIDPEPAVRAQALYALAEIGRDPDGRITETIAKMMLREHLQIPDFRVTYAALVAIERINADPLNTVHGAAVEMLLEVAQGGPYNQLIRNKAREILTAM
jgi:hypothetical protein